MVQPALRRLSLGRVVLQVKVVFQVKVCEKLVLHVIRVFACAFLALQGPASKGAWTLGSFEEAFLQTLNPYP